MAHTVLTKVTFTMPPLVFLRDKVGMANRCFQQRVAMKYADISPVPVTW